MDLVEEVIPVMPQSAFAFALLEKPVPITP